MITESDLKFSLATYIEIGLNNLPCRRFNFDALFSLEGSINGSLEGWNPDKEWAFRNRVIKDMNLDLMSKLMGRSFALEYIHLFNSLDKEGKGKLNWFLLEKIKEFKN